MLSEVARKRGAASVRRRREAALYPKPRPGPRSVAPSASRAASISASWRPTTSSCTAPRRASSPRGGPGWTASWEPRPSGAAVRPGGGVRARGGRIPQRHAARAVEVSGASGYPARGLPEIETVSCARTSRGLACSTMVTPHPDPVNRPDAPTADVSAIRARDRRSRVTERPNLYGEVSAPTFTARRRTSYLDIHKLSAVRGLLLPAGGFWRRLAGERGSKSYPRSPWSGTNRHEPHAGPVSSGSYDERPARHVLAITSKEIG